jgi:hypothetical protein
MSGLPPRPRGPNSLGRGGDALMRTKPQRLDPYMVIGNDVAPLTDLLVKDKRSLHRDTRGDRIVAGPLRVAAANHDMRVRQRNLDPAGRAAKARSRSNATSSVRARSRRVRETDSKDRLE